jgi:hypothetical protein
LSAAAITAALMLGEFIHSNPEVDMTPEATQEYQRAIEEAANAFMKVMSLRGFSDKAPMSEPMRWSLTC